MPCETSTRRAHRAARASRGVLALLAAVIAATLATACASAGRGEPVAEDEPTTIEIDNQGFLDANIFVMRGSQRIRLGTVPGASRRVFTIPSNLIFAATPLRFRAEPIGSNATPTSHEIVVHRGDQVRLTLRGW